MNRVPAVMLVVEADPDLAHLLDLRLPLGGYVVIVVPTHRAGPGVCAAADARPDSA